MNVFHDNKNKPGPDSISKNTLFKVIIGGVAGTLLAKVVTIPSMARALGMSTGGFIVSCIIIALLVAILVRLKKTPVLANETELEPKIKEHPIAEQGAPSDGDKPSN